MVLFEQLELSSKSIFILEFLKMANKEEDIKKLMKCVNFATIKHRNQRRKDPQETPYINHPIGKILYKI